MRGFDRVEPEIEVGTSVRLMESALDGYVSEARLKMSRGRVGTVTGGGFSKGTVRVCFPTVGRRKEYRQDLRVSELEVVSPLREPAAATKRPSM